MNIAVMSVRSFFRHQQTLLLPVIRKVWKDRQAWILAALQAEQRDLVCGGDGRADSPGHSAKFGSYTMIELHANAVIDIQLVQVCSIYLVFNILGTTWLSFRSSTSI